MEKLLLDEFTQPEISERIRNCDIAFFPVGTQEGHGPLMPLGTDMYIASAVAAMTAREMGGIALHPLAYSFTGATNGYRGTVSIPMSLETEVIKAVIRNLWAQKFRRIFILNVHGPNDIPIKMAIRELFEYKKIIAAYYNPYTSVSAAEYNYDDCAKETAMCHAAMKVLGKEECIPRNSGQEDVPYPPLNLPGFDKEGLVTGFHYNQLYQHQPPRKVDIATGMVLLESAVTQLIELLEQLKEYVTFIEKGGNHPYSI
ncbi:MAG: creatininase family protein [Victivallales bacterium]